MSKQPRLLKQLWHKAERYGFVFAYLFMVFCMFFAFVFLFLGVSKVAGACMSLAGWALLVILFVFNEKKEK
jgi:hypothetical protein